MATGQTLIVIEDDPNIADLLDTYLRSTGFRVLLAPGGQRGLELISQHSPALAILDIGLPDIDGFEVCRRIRSTSQMPVLFLTARDGEIDRVLGLELGADDYVTKPFSPREIVARVKAILRRGQPVSSEDATVIRGGFAVAYDPAFYNILLNLQNVAPYSAALQLSSANALVSTTTSPLPLPANPTGTNNQAIASASGVLPLGKLNPIYLAQTQVSSNFHSPYSEQFSFGIQRQLNRRNVFEVSYVGTQGVGLFQSVNGNFFTKPLVNGLDLGGGYTFPSFSSKLPAGIGFQTCVDNPATLFEF